jgi:membrane associated rhomboid family serine protease
MTSRHHRGFRLLAPAVAVVAVAMPATAAASGNAPATDPANNPVVVRVEGGFDWAAAGVGAAGGVGLSLVVGAGAFSQRRRQRVDAGSGLTLYGREP